MLFDGERPPVSLPPRLGQHTRASLLDAGVSDAQIDAVAKYALTMPSEVCMKFWRSLSGEHVKNTVKIHDQLTDRIVSILNPNAKK